MKHPEPMQALLIDARTKAVYGTPLTPGQLAVVAMDLPDDLWRDFQFFLEHARAAEQSDQSEQRYRFLRAALFCLFAHLNAFFDLLIASRKADKPFQEFRRTELSKLKTKLGTNFPRCEHGEFVVVFSEFLSRHHGRQLPTVDLKVKLLRNILAHPVSRKTDVSVADLYDLDLDQLESAASSLTSWLDDACRWCGVDRRIDTAELVEGFIREWMGHQVRAHRF